MSALRAAGLIAGLAALSYLGVRQHQAAQVPEPEQTPSWWNIDSLIDTMKQTITPDTPSPDNRAAFLMAIRAAEGTAGPDGYRVMFGGGLFDGWADHPRIAHQFTDRAGRKLWTSAAGAYQFMAISPIPGGKSTRVDTWDRLRAKLGLPDFSPASQDAAALELVRECGALGDVDAGRLADAVGKCRRVWASLPGAGYSQPERSLAWVAERFVQAGGVIA